MWVNCFLIDQPTDRSAIIFLLRLPDVISVENLLINQFEEANFCIKIPINQDRTFELVNISYRKSLLSVYNLIQLKC